MCTTAWDSYCLDPRITMDCGFGKIMRGSFVSLPTTCSFATTIGVRAPYVEGGPHQKSTTPALGGSREVRFTCCGHGREELAYVTMHDQEQITLWGNAAIDYFPAMGVKVPPLGAGETLHDVGG